MKKLIFTIAALAASYAAGAQSQPESRFRLRFFPQIAVAGHNTVGYPGNTGTRFSLTDDLHKTNSVRFSPRLEFEYIYRRNHFMLTGSLLRDKFDGTLPFGVQFGNQYFESGTPLRSVYRFNTYRFTYRYGVVDNPKFKLELGATILVRDAMISLADCCDKVSFYNVGVVPLISYSITWQPIPELAVLSYGDAFAVRKGRAEDIFAGVRYDFIDHFALLAGYRLLEGGGKGDKVYTFALYNYFSVGLEVKF